MPHVDIASVLEACPQCPVCGSDDRERNVDPPTGISPYTKTVAKALGLAPDDLFERAPLWNCRKCGAVWRDPWFTRDFADTLYGYVFGQHFHGWASLGVWLEDKPHPYLDYRKALWRHLRDHFPGSAMTYAELNCPLSGLVFAELDAQDTAENHGLGRRRMIDLKRVYSESPLLSRATGSFIDRGKRLAMDEAAGFLVGRTLLTEDSPYCWRRACIHKGASCHAYAHGFLFDRIVPLTVAEASGESFDLVGVFHTLDHIPDPVGTMKRMLGVGTRALLEMHAPGWSDIQHFFGLGNGFPDLMRSMGAHVRDLTPWVRPVTGERQAGDSVFFLFSMEDDLSWLPPDRPD